MTGPSVSELVAAALREDVGSGDRTTERTVPEDARASGVLLAKQDLVLSGLTVARAVFEALDAHVSWEEPAAEGTSVGRGATLVRVHGAARALLTAERVALNFLQRLSGIATLTRRFVVEVEGTKARIRDTRKTTPLLRSLEKEAVRAGGGSPHRFGLDSAVLVKDNHIRIAGSVLEATRRAQGAGLPVEVEVDRKEQIAEALEGGCSMILLDNFAPDAIAEAVGIVGGRVPVEVSGGITLGTVRLFAEAGPDFISVGALTHSAPAADISLEIDPS
jgi:nicotinate-nucleotide pyrophosphorylase (carboxylating)